MSTFGTAKQAYLNSLPDYKHGVEDKVNAIRTGAVFIDWALGGGFERGHIHEIAGESQSGKTFLALCAAAQAQKIYGDHVVFLDYEKTFPKSVAESVGMALHADDFTRLLPSTVEEGIDMMRYFSGLSANVERSVLFIVDSYPMLLPGDEVDKGESAMMARAKGQTKFVYQAVPILANYYATMLLINHVRVDVTANKRGWGGPQRISSGADALKFLAFQRIVLSTVELIKRKTRLPGAFDDGDTNVPIAARVRGLVIKNKRTKPWRQGQFALLFGTRIMDEYIAVLEGPKCSDFVVKKGGIYKFDNDPTGENRWEARNCNGWIAASRFIRDTPGLYRAIMADILAVYENSEFRENNNDGPDTDDDTIIEPVDDA